MCGTSQKNGSFVRPSPDKTLGPIPALFDEVALHTTLVTATVATIGDEVTQYLAPETRDRYGLIWRHGYWYAIAM